MQRLRHWTAQSEFRASNLFHAFGLQNNESSVIHFRGTYFSKQSLFLTFHENSLKYLQHFEGKKCEYFYLGWLQQPEPHRPPLCRQVGPRRPARTCTAGLRSSFGPYRSRYQPKNRISIKCITNIRILDVNMTEKWNYLELKKKIKSTFDLFFWIVQKENSLEKLSILASWAQCPRTDLSKRFLPKQMTTTGWKGTP